MIDTATLWDDLDGPGAELEANLVAIALDLIRQTPLLGVTVGEVVKIAEERGMKIGGAPMTDPAVEERQTSWLPKIMRRAQLVSTDRMRRSPIKRHKGRRQVVWVQQNTEAS